MSCSITKDLCLQQGASKTFLITVLDDDGNPVDLTGGALYFTVRQLITDVNPVILKTSAVVTEIEILPQTGDTLGQAKIYIQPSDTAGLSTAAPYVYDVWVELASGNNYPVIAPSCLTIEPSVTNIGSPGSPVSLVDPPISGAMFTFRPGDSTADGPNIFDDFDELYAKFQEFRTDNPGGFANILFDDRVTSPVVLPTTEPEYDFSNTDWVGVSRTGFDFGHAEVDVPEGFVMGSNFPSSFRNIQINPKMTATPVITPAVGQIVQLDDYADISPRTGAAAAFIDASALDGGAGEFFVMRLGNGTSVGRAAQAYETVELGTNAIFLLENFGGVFNKRSLRGLAGSCWKVSLRDQDSLFGTGQTNFLGGIVANFGFAVKGPRINFTPATTVVVVDSTIGHADMLTLADASGGDITLTLDTMPGTSFDNYGQSTRIVNVGASGNVSVIAGGTNTILGPAVLLGPGESAELVPDGASRWVRVS